MDGREQALDAAAEVAAVEEVADVRVVHQQAALRH
jgi:hypothetical protein